MTIQLNGATLSIAEVWRGAKLEEPCTIDDQARPAIRRCRALVEDLSQQPRAIYGINTGFGPLSDFRIPPESQREHQLHLIHHLSTGQGALFSAAETRAIIIARCNTLARGYSGIREEPVDLLLGAMNAGVLPEIPQEGSVGASGDLVPLAHMTRLILGLGHARVKEQRLPAREALAKVDLQPLELLCKEGLALVNGTSVMTGLAALSSHEAQVLLSWIELLTACLFQALSGAPEVLCDALHRARGHQGQRLCARRIAAHLSSHPQYAREISEHLWGSQAKPFDSNVEIQDPYSLRCAPQILGAFQDALWHVEKIVALELNASTDNPLIFPEPAMVIHGGNFYGQQIAMTSDYLRIGLISLALLVERQLERLTNWRLSRGLPAFLSGAEPGINSGFAGCQLLATSLAAEARLLGTAASIQTIPTNAENQDVVSMGATAARMTRQVLPLLWKLVSIEALALAQAADLRPGPALVMGADFQKLHDRVRSVSPKLIEDRPLFEDIDAVRQLLQREEVQAALLPPRPNKKGA
jgi:histidine ammonia-lyase